MMKYCLGIDFGIYQFQDGILVSRDPTVIHDDVREAKFPSVVPFHG